MIAWFAQSKIAIGGLVEISEAVRGGIRRDRKLLEKAISDVSNQFLIIYWRQKAGKMSL